MKKDQDFYDMSEEDQLNVKELQRELQKFDHHETEFEGNINKHS